MFKREFISQKKKKISIKNYFLCQSNILGELAVCNSTVTTTYLSQQLPIKKESNAQKIAYQ